jgi:hypothetical protein
MNLKVIRNGRHPAKWEDPDAAKIAFHDAEPDRWNIQIESAHGHEIVVKHIYANYSMTAKSLTGILIPYGHILTIAAITLEFKGATFVFAGLNTRSVVDAYSACEAFADEELYYVFRPQVI